MTSPDSDPSATSETSSETSSDTTAPTVPGEERPVRPVLRTVLLAVLVLVLLAASAVFVTAVATRTATEDAGVLDRTVDAVRGVNSVQQQREEVMSAASQFMLRLNTYGPDLLEGGEMPEYRRLVTEVITPSFLTSFEQQVTAAEQTVANAGLGRRCELSGVGVATMDADSATALVAGFWVNSYPLPETDESGEAQPGEPDAERVDDVPTRFRVAVELVRIDGEWLVDDFGPASRAGEEQAPLPGLPPTPETSPGPRDGGATGGTGGQQGDRQQGDRQEGDRQQGDRQQGERRQRGNGGNR